MSDQPKFVPGRGILSWWWRLLLIAFGIFLIALSCHLLISSVSSDEWVVKTSKFGKTYTYHWSSTSARPVIVVQFLEYLSTLVAGFGLVLLAGKDKSSKLVVIGLASSLGGALLYGISEVLLRYLHATQIG